MLAVINDDIGRASVVTEESRDDRLEVVRWTTRSSSEASGLKNG